MASSAISSTEFNLLQFLNDGRWKYVLSTIDAFDKDFITLEDILQNVYDKDIEVFPPRAFIFNALHFTPLETVKVVIVGQDPYHGNGQAMGLSFSVPIGIDVPPSLNNLYTKLKKEIPEFVIPNHGCLVEWAKEGVLMLNSALTVQAHVAESHSKLGWQILTDAIIKAASYDRDHVVFILFGKVAEEKKKWIDKTKHATIITSHPSRSSKEFKRCKIFSECNKILEKRFRLPPVNWGLSSAESILHRYADLPGVAVPFRFQ